MIDAEELVFCKRRGHMPKAGVRNGWVPCELCGMWLRELVILEEREDDPPEGDQNPLIKMRNRLEAPDAP